MNKRKLLREAEAEKAAKEEKKRSRTKFSDIVTAVLFLGIIFGFGIAFAVLPDADENSFETGLQRFPEAAEGEGADYVLHGEMAKDFDEYFCDQFPLRKEFVTLKALIETASGRRINNGVLYSNGMLAQVRFDAVGTPGNTEFYSEEHVSEMTSSLKAELDKLDIPARVLCPPRAIDVLGPMMDYPTDIGDALNAQIKAELGDYYVDVLPLLRDPLEDRNPLEGAAVTYYTVDHHWTATGAFYAYREAVASFGDTPHEFERFDFPTVFSKFSGTSLRNGNYFFVHPETIQYCHYDGGEDMEVKLGKNLNFLTEKEGMYDYEALYGPDPYNFYLYGKTDYVTITAPEEEGERETLLLLKDSFSHCMAPILASNYNIVMVDIDLLTNEELGRTINLSSLIEQTGADKVLIEYNLQNVMENRNLSLIKAD